jgi:hypothetical protein
MLKPKARSYHLPESRFLIKALLRPQHHQPHRSIGSPAFPQQGQANDRDAAETHWRRHSSNPTTRSGQDNNTPKTHDRKPNSEGPTPNDQKTPTEEAIDMTLLIRDKLNEGFNLLRELSLKLKVINRDQRTSARELNTIRSSLRSLQGLKL